MASQPTWNALTNVPEHVNGTVLMSGSEESDSDHRSPAPAASTSFAAAPSVPAQGPTVTSTTASYASVNPWQQQHQQLALPMESVALSSGVAPVPTFVHAAAATAAPPKKRKRRTARPKTDEPVRKSSRRHSGLFGNPDRPTYREPSSDEDEANESDGDPPFLGSPYQHGPIHSVPSSPAKESDYTGQGSLARSLSGSVPPAETMDRKPAPIVQPPLSNYQEWSKLENIVFSTPKGFTSLVFEIASNLGMVVVVTDDRTTKAQSAYMHITCAYRRAGCPFILKLAKAKEGGWVLRPQNPPPSDVPSDAKLARSNYNCVHPPKDELGSSLHPSLGGIDTAMPPKKKQKMPKQPTRVLPARKAPQQAAPSASKQNVVSSMDIEAGAADEVYQSPATRDPATSGALSGGRMSGKKVESRILAPPFTRSLLLDQKIAPALSGQSGHAQTGLRAPAHSGALPFGDLAPGHTVVVYRPAILPAPNPPPQLSVLPKQSSLADWQTYLAALHSDFVPLAKVLALPTLAVSPQSFFAESIELRLAMIDMLEAEQVGVWPRMRLKAAVRDRGEQVWTELVKGGKISPKLPVEDVPIQPVEPAVSDSQVNGTRVDRQTSVDNKDVQMTGVETRSSSARPSPEVEDSDDGHFVPDQNQYTARLQALYSGANSVQGPPAPTETAATADKSEVDDASMAMTVAPEAGAPPVGKSMREMPTRQDKTFIGVEVPKPKSKQSTEDSVGKTIASEVALGTKAVADTSKTTFAAQGDELKKPEPKSLKVTLASRSGDSLKSADGSSESLQSVVSTSPQSASAPAPPPAPAEVESDSGVAATATTTTKVKTLHMSNAVPPLKPSLLSRIRSKAQSQSPVKVAPSVKPVAPDRRASFAEFEATWLRGER
ncbi:hypothetical protein OIV83_001936 [Microbotryomycetes sp. JL201]|nr:hypothetical protein OIV83_001936 [Microbotryomycetes sp. JL201]